MTDVGVGSMVVEVQDDGPPVLFVHGLGGSSNSFQPLMASAPGRRRIRPDLPGSARSPMIAVKPDLAELARRLLEMLRVLGVGEAHVVGHSMGSLICQYMAVLEPMRVRSLTLFGAILEPPDQARDRLRARAQTVRRDGMGAIADTVTDAGLSGETRSQNPVAVAFVRESHMRQDPAGFAWGCEALAAATAADLASIKCPALMVTGAEDAIAPPSMAQSLADGIDQGRTVIVDRCGHWPTIERPEKSASLLREMIGKAF